MGLQRSPRPCSPLANGQKTNATDESRIHPHAAAEPLTTPRLSGMDNVRDIAGTTTAYGTAHDGTMRAGVFYRSSALTRPLRTWSR